MSQQFQPLPEDDDALIFRDDVKLYGGPAAATLAKYASRPSEAPCELPYTMVGRRATYTAGTLRRLRKVMTFKHSADRAARRQKVEAKPAAAA